MIKNVSILVLNSFLIALPFSSYADTNWVAGNRSCATVCESANSTPMQSGIYKNGNPFYICRANPQGEGKRAGYNLQPDWSTNCTVGWGGKELPVSSYECLCVN